MSSEFIASFCAAYINMKQKPWYNSKLCIKLLVMCHNVVKTINISNIKNIKLSTTNPISRSFYKNQKDKTKNIELHFQIIC